MGKYKLLKAVYDFTTAYITTLNFAAGDYFYLYQSKTNQENWLLATNKRGELGFVPSAYVAELEVSPYFYTTFIEKIIAALGEFDAPLTKGQVEVLERLLERKRTLRILPDESHKCRQAHNSMLADFGTKLAQFWTKAGLGNMGEIPPPVVEGDQEAQYKSLVAIADQRPKCLRFNSVVGLEEYNDLELSSTKEFADKVTQSEKKSMLLRWKRKLSLKKEPHFVVNEMQYRTREDKNEWDEIRLECNAILNEEKTGLPNNVEEIECEFKIRGSGSNGTIDDIMPAEVNFEDKKLKEKGIQYGSKELRSRIHKMQGYRENAQREPHVNLNRSQVRWNESRSSGDEIQSPDGETVRLKSQPDNEIKLGHDMSKFTMVAAPVSMQYAAGNMSAPFAMVDEEPDECEWCEFGMLILAIVFLVFVSALNMFWALYFCEGYAWGENSIRQFNLHPSLMCIGLITFSGFSILIYRICRCMRIMSLRVLHALFDVLAVPCIVLGLLATWKLNIPDAPQKAHYSSLHSWLGVVALSWFGLQSLFAFLRAVMPFIPTTKQMRSVRIMGEVHATCGLLSFVLSVCCCLTGFSENVLQLLSNKYTTLPEERVFVNLIGLVLIILLLLFLCITLPRFHYSRVWKNSRVKESFANS